MARKFWPGQNPIGRRVKDIGPGNLGAEVIGVVRDVRMRSSRHPAQPMLFVPLDQFYLPRMTILIGSNSEPGALARAVDAGGRPARCGPASLSRPHARRQARQLARPGTPAREPLSAFAGCSLCCSRRPASTASSPTRRRCGRASSASASRSARARRTSAGSCSATERGSPAIGLAVGLAIAALASRVVAALLYGISPLDPVSYAGAAALLLATVLAASLLPARRASRLDPMATLRSE